ncbi:hypothetical protein [Erwinia amylovora]|nr:hypothetical protein [Erwinia amylovora]
MAIKFKSEKDTVAIKSEDKKRSRKNLKKSRMLKTANKRGGWLTEY